MSMPSLSMTTPNKEEVVHGRGCRFLTACGGAHGYRPAPLAGQPGEGSPCGQAGVGLVFGPSSGQDNAEGRGRRDDADAFVCGEIEQMAVEIT